MSLMANTQPMLLLRAQEVALFDIPLKKFSFLRIFPFPCLLKSKSNGYGRHNDDIRLSVVELVQTFVVDVFLVGIWRSIWVYKENILAIKSIGFSSLRGLLLESYCLHFFWKIFYFTLRLNLRGMSVRARPILTSCWWEPQMILMHSSLKQMRRHQALQVGYDTRKQKKKILGLAVRTCAFFLVCSSKFFFLR